MSPSTRRLVLGCAAACLAMLSPSYAAPDNPNLRNLPPLMLWAWERSEDLRGLAPDTGVAFLAQTITLSGSRFNIVGRRQPLRVSADTRLVAVTRIEAPRHDVHLDAAAIDGVAAAIAHTTELPRVIGVQVDFDAVASERPLYRQLLTHLRRQLPSDTPVSITALASWCEGDPWISGLPMDEAVPMVFRMGPINAPFASAGASGAWTAVECRRALGTSLDEPFGFALIPRRVYVFNPAPWNDDSLREARRLVAR